MDELEEFIVLSGGKLYQFLLKYTRNPSVTEDILQDTYMKAFLALQQEVPENMEAWLMTIAKYTMYDYFRKEQKIVIQTDDLSFLLVDDTSLPDEKTLRKEEREQLVQWINQLPKTQQKSFVLVVIDNYSYEEASTILKIPVNTVKSHVKRSREKLQEYREKEGEDNGNKSIRTNKKSRTKK